MRDCNVNQVKSLVGKIDPSSMGAFTSRDKPKRSAIKKTHQEEPTQKQKAKADILEEKFDQSLTYKPKTKENKLIYENFLGKVYELVEDQPPQTLLAIADEVLAIIHNEDISDKRADISVLVGAKIKEDQLIDLLTIGKSLTDYKMENYNDDNQQAIQIQEEHSEEEEEQQQFQEVVQEEEQVEGVKVQEQEERPLNLTDMDNSWLKNKLSEIFDMGEAQRLQKQVLAILEIKSAMEVQNGLLSLLNYDHLSLIDLLMKHRKIIYYGTRYYQAAQRDREAVVQEIKIQNLDLRGLVKRVESQQQQIDQERQDIVGDIHRTIKDQDIAKINRKLIDLTLHDSEDRTNKKQQYKFKLPQNAERIEKAGFEQIYIPFKFEKINQELKEVQDLPSWMQGVFTGIKKFNPIQSAVLPYTMNTNQNFLVCAPTSSGKTNVALLSILKMIQNYRDQQTGIIDLTAFKAVYIAPMKALVSEITGNLGNRLKALGVSVKELTGDVHLNRFQIQDTQIIVSTPEKWDIITRKAGQKLFLDKVKLLIIDEIHLLSDTRGPVLESIIARTIRQGELKPEEKIRIVGLSATLPNYRDVGATLRTQKEGIFYFDTSYRPIPLEQRYIGVTQKKGVRKMLMINQILYEKVMERAGKHQMIVFVHSRRDTVRTANYIKDTAYAKNDLHRIIKPDSESKKIIQLLLEKQTVNSKELKELLVHGIGIHHAGLTRADRDLVQQLFADRHLAVLVSTATLAWGVNLPAHTVIIKGTQVYSPEKGHWVELSLQDILQMLGRAGRPKFDSQGEGIILTGYEEVRYYLGLLSLQIPLESHMLSSLADQINAQVVMGVVNNIRDAVNWLSYTYLYVRMLKNPKHYSISSQEVQEDKQLIKRRVNITHTVFTALEKNGLLSYDRKSGTVSSTFLGKVAANYYIKYTSMSIYNNNLKSNFGLTELLKIFSLSEQFKYLTVREEEKNQLKKLIQTVPIPIKGTHEEITSKITALLQAHISRLHLDGLALNADKIYVIQSAGRISRALFQICLKRNWGHLTQRALQLAKMIDKGMWSCLNPLRQFSQIPEYVLARLEKKEQFNWESFYQMNPQQIGQLTKFPKLGRILHKFVHHIPRLQLEAYAQPISRSCLRVNLTVTVDFKWQDEHHGKQEPFWLFALDCNEQTILYSYYFLIEKGHQSVSFEIFLPLFETIHPLYYIKVVSDRWITPDAVLPLSFRNMILPSKFSPTTQLMDLPTSTNADFPKQMKIRELNQVQAQAISAFLGNNHNIFLGASQGTGKFTLAVLAISQTLQAGKKAVVIVWNQSIAQRRTAWLSKTFNKKKVGKTCDELAKNALILSGCDVIVSTPQAWEVLLRKWRARKGFSEIDLVVVDGLHLLGTQNQGMSLQICLSKLRLIATQQPNLRLICLSSPIADYKQVAQWIGSPSENTFNFHPSVRPNSVQVIFNSFQQPIKQSRNSMMLKSLVQNIRHYSKNTMVIVQGKKQARSTALELVSELVTDANSKRFKKIKDTQIQTFSKKISDQYLLHVLEYGIGYVYEGMPELERQIIQELFRLDAITILIVTYPLRYQLQHKAFLVILLDCVYWDTRTHNAKDYSLCDMLQFMSFCNQSERDKTRSKQFSTAKFIIFCHPAKKYYYKKFLFQPLPLESIVHTDFPNILNGQIVAKAVETKSDAVDLLTWTFMYRRLSHNPNFYNMDVTSEQAVSVYLSDLIDESVEYLVQAKCVQIDNENEEALQATNLGIICSYYQLKVQTIAQFLKQIQQSLKLKDILKIISGAEQFASVQFKGKEYQVLAQLVRQTSQDPFNKIYSIIICYLHRITLTPELNAEAKIIVPLLLKLTHALVDVISSIGYLKPLIICMQLSQMVVQGMWSGETQLMQFMDKKTANLLSEKYGVKTIEKLGDMEEGDRNSALGKDIEKIASAWNRYPAITLEKTAQFQGQQCKLAVSLSRSETYQTSIIISQTYPKEKEQFWWVVVGDRKNNKVLATKRVVVKEKAEVELNFEVEKSQKIIVYAICDSYIGCDQAEEFDPSV